MQIAFVGATNMILASMFLTYKNDTSHDAHLLTKKKKMF